MISRILFIVLLNLCLSSCAITLHKQQIELHLAKMNFENGEYKHAFHQLLPLAADGNSEAEYALGYLYYYGYGTPVDTESGMFWMQRSALKGYVPARRAHELIQEKNARRDVEAVAPAPSPPVMHYTLQIFGSYQLDAVKKMQEKMPEKDKLKIWVGERENKTWYILGYDQYAALYQAKISLDFLPGDIKSLKPWPRCLDDVKLLFQ